MIPNPLECKTSTVQLLFAALVVMMVRPATNLQDTLQNPPNPILEARATKDAAAESTAAEAAAGGPCASDRAAAEATAAHRSGLVTERSLRGFGFRAFRV